MDMIREAKRVQREGRKAYRDGKNLNSNPYDKDATTDMEESVRYKSWRNGWLFQKYLDRRSGILV